MFLSAAPCYSGSVEALLWSAVLLPAWLESVQCWKEGPNWSDANASSGHFAKQHVHRSIALRKRDKQPWPKRLTPTGCSQDYKRAAPWRCFSSVCDCRHTRVMWWHLPAERIKELSGWPAGTGVTAISVVAPAVQDLYALNLTSSALQLTDKLCECACTCVAWTNVTRRGDRREQEDCIILLSLDVKRR